MCDVRHQQFLSKGYNCPQNHFYTTFRAKKDHKKRLFATTTKREGIKRDALIKRNLKL